MTPECITRVLLIGERIGCIILPLSSGDTFGRPKCCLGLPVFLCESLKVSISPPHLDNFTPRSTWTVLHHCVLPVQPWADWMLYAFIVCRWYHRQGEMLFGPTEFASKTGHHIKLFHHTKVGSLWHADSRGQEIMLCFLVLPQYSEVRDQLFSSGDTFGRPNVVSA